MSTPRRIRTVIPLAALLVLAMAGPASATAYEGEAYRTSKSISTAYFGYTDVCAEVYTHVVVEDHGKFVQVNTGSNASFRIYTCSTGATRTDLSGTLTWTVTAKGFSIDCAAQVPLGFSCGGSSTAKSSVFSSSARGKYRRVIGSGEKLTFEDGSFGDTSSVRSTVHVLVHGVGFSDAVEVSS